MKKLGGDVVLVNQSGSSISKGESLPDTSEPSFSSFFPFFSAFFSSYLISFNLRSVRTLDKYADVIVIRHPGVGSAQEASKFSAVPVINAGDGIGEHPTQV